MVWSLGGKICGRLGISIQKYVYCRKKERKVVRNAGKSRPKWRWNEVVKDDLKKCGMDRGLAKDRER